MSECDKGSAAPPRNLMPAAWIVFGAWIVLAVFSSRCLYADGSHEFIRVLEARNFVSLMWSRHFAFYLYEFPLVIAIKLGVTNMSWLRFAFGLGCFLPWPVVLLCCRWISPQHFWIAVVGCAAGYLNACYMAVGEHILAHAFFWSSLFVIVFGRPLKPPAAVILLASATALLFSYESQFLLCLPLAGLSCWRMVAEMRERPRQPKIWSWIVLAVAGGLFFTASGIGLYAILNPEIPTNYAGFRANVEAILSNRGWTLNWSLAWGGLMLAAAFSKKIWELICQRTGMVILFFALFLWGMAPLLAPNALEPARQYNNRILDLVVPLVLLPAVLILKYRPLWIGDKAAALSQMAAIFLMVQSVWQINATWQWQRDVGKLQGILTSYRGVVPLDSTIMAGSSMESWTREFDWTWPCLSIALNPGPQIRCLVCSKLYVAPEYRDRFHFWQPFDPLDFKTLPDLRHYGINFDDYIETLQTNSTPPEPGLGR